MNFLAFECHFNLFYAGKQPLQINNSFSKLDEGLLYGPENGFVVFLVGWTREDLEGRLLANSKRPQIHSLPRSGTQVVFAWTITFF